MHRGLHRSVPWYSSTVILSAVLGTVLFGGPAALAGSPPPIWSSNTASWSNGVITCQFPSDRLGMSARATGVDNSALYVGFGQLEELRPNGSVTAVARMSPATWSIDNETRSGTLELSYHAGVSERPVTANTSLGTVSVRVNLSLPAYSELAAADASYVTIDASFSNWSWQAPGDSLALTMVTWPTSNASERLAADAGSQVDAVSSSNGTVVQYVHPGSMALATFGPGVVTSIPAVATATLAPNRGTILVTFGPGSGAYENLRYTSIVGVAGSTRVLGIPLYEYGAVLVAGGACSLMVAVGVRNARRRPSDLLGPHDALAARGHPATSRDPTGFRSGPISPSVQGREQWSEKR